MKRNGMRLTDLAEISNINIGTLSRIRKSHKINFSTLNKIASALDEKDLNNLVSREIDSTKLK
nr:helix-turn-helix transcriptional regulator [Virgibacillus halodenitrificans]